MSQNPIHEVPANHVLAAVLQSDAVLGQVQREIYRLLPGISIEQLRSMLRSDLLQRGLVEGEDAQEAEALLKRMSALRARGLTETQTLKAVTGREKVAEDDEDDVYHILMQDKRSAGGGG
jgi:hypothetical protein